MADAVPVSSTAITNIGAVQGSTPGGNAASPLSDQSVTVSGVVTGVYPGLGGFFVQEEGINADQDDSTSDGIFVYCTTNCGGVKSGNAVTVTGAVSEYNELTELTSSAITVQQSGLSLPTAASLQLPLDTAQQERYEGMRVTFPQTLTVTNNYGYGRYGQLDLSNGERVFNSTNGNAKTGQSTITLDDGISTQNPADLAYLSSENTRRTGDTVTGLDGIWHVVAKLPMVEPLTVNFTNANSRAANAQPKDVGGSLRIGGANVLNYFTDLNTGYSTASGAPRGANSAAKLKRQRDKTANTLSTLNADVLALMEVQNKGDTALNDIVAALNEKVGAGTYAAISTGTVGTDVIKVGIIYKPSKVTPVGNPLIDNNSVNNRPTVAQTFWDKSTGGVFTVVGNHFKSKGSCNGSDPDNGQGCWNNLRVQQATQLLKFVDTIKQQSGDQDVILLGDFNAYGAEDPIKTLQQGGFESLNLRIPAEDRYSYQFSSAFGYLDHALASNNLNSQVTGITEWHVKGKDLYDASNPFRASDHDPVLVGLNLTHDADQAPAGANTGTNPGTGTTDLGTGTTNPGTGTSGLNHLVISQVYGGGGNSGSMYSAGGSGGKTALSGSIKPGSYYLVQEAKGSNSSGTLPAPEATGNLAMATTDGTVTLWNGTTNVDTVGYGSATKKEGSAAPTLSNATAAIRNGGGCVDTDNNSADFTATTPSPRNGSSATNICQ